MNNKRAKVFTRAICLVLATLMILGTFGTLVFGADIKYVDDKGKTVKLNDFRDTAGHWAHDTILKWADYEMIVGYQGNFMPNEPMKRGDVAVVLDRMMGLTTMSYNYFNDLPNDAYYRDPMLRCVAAGYFSGTSANTVNPLGNTTREEMAVILCRVFQIDTSNTGKTKFVDDNEIASWARPSIYALSKLGYMNGDGYRVNPKANITRAEIIQLFDNIAEVFIPKKDTTRQGSTFSIDSRRNLVAARNIDLNRSSIGRDLISTQSVKTLNLRYTNVLGRLIVLGSTNVTFSNSDVSRVEVYNKSTLNGITNTIDEVYIAEYGTESTLDAIPERLILEPGVRVKIAGTMYENTTTRTKTYYGLDIKADIAAEQGYVIGGPKISGIKVSQTFDNTVIFNSIKIQLGESKISEVGVIYSNSSLVTPTLSNYDRKIKYTSYYTDNLELNIGTISGERTYRVYAIDSNGLISYSSPVTLKAYSYNIDLEIFDVNYPQTIRAEVLFSGTNIPEISSVKVSHNTTSLYAEDINVVNMSQANVEKQDIDKYGKNVIRYVGEVKSATEVDKTTGERVYIPPTEFGYIITFKEGSVVKKFPVLTNAVPDGIAPVDTLTTGNARFTTNNKLEVTNNFIRTRHVSIQEAGIIYREVPTGTTIREPEAGGSGWKTQSSYVNVGLKDTASFNATLPISSTTGETHFAAYIKTANGYFYGEVKKVQNNWVGAEKGPKITGTPEVLILDENTAVVKIPVSLNRTLDFNKYGSIVSFTESGGREVTFYDGMSLTQGNVYVSVKKSYIVLTFDKLSANKTYDVVLQLFDTVGDASNALSFNIDTSKMINISLTNRVETTSKLTFDINISGFSNYNSIFATKNVEVLNVDSSASIDTSTYPWKLVIRNAPEGRFNVVAEFTYYISRSIGDIKSVTFERILSVQN